MIDTYFNTFIQVATDCPAKEATIPKAKPGSKSIAELEYEMISQHPYEYTQSEVQFAVHLAHKSIPKEGEPAARKAYFSVPHACLRASALAKRYGWGFHFDDKGRVALVAVESPRYRELSQDPSIEQTNGMRSKR